MPTLPNGRTAPKKKKPAPKRKPSIKKGAAARAAIPGYKVPKGLLKNTAANRAAGPVREGQKLTAAEKKAYKEGSAELRKKAQDALKPKSTTATASKAASSKLDEMAQAQGWMKSQGLGSLGGYVKTVSKKKKGSK